MKRKTIVAFLAFSLVGCGDDSNTDSLVGTWGVTAIGLSSYKDGSIRVAFGDGIKC